VTGVPNCFCRDLLQQTGYKTVAKCMLKQACENALRDWNKVFGEGYMVEGEAEDWNTESPLRTCTRSDYAHDSWSHAFGYVLLQCLAKATFSFDPLLFACRNCKQHNLRKLANDRVASRSVVTLAQEVRSLSPCR
jgi:hypothetical protein